MKTFYQKIDAFNAKNMYEINKDDLFRTVESALKSTDINRDRALRQIVLDRFPNLGREYETLRRRRSTHALHTGDETYAGTSNEIDFLLGYIDIISTCAHAIKPDYQPEFKLGLTADQTKALLTDMFNCYTRRDEAREELLHGSGVVECMQDIEFAKRNPNTGEIRNYATEEPRIQGNIRETYMRKEILKAEMKKRNFLWRWFSKSARQMRKFINEAERALKDVKIPQEAIEQAKRDADAPAVRADDLKMTNKAIDFLYKQNAEKEMLELKNSMMTLNYRPNPAKINDHIKAAREMGEFLAEENKKLPPDVKEVLAMNCDQVQLIAKARKGKISAADADTKCRMMRKAMLAKRPDYEPMTLADVEAREKQRAEETRRVIAELQGEAQKLVESKAAAQANANPAVVDAPKAEEQPKTEEPPKTEIPQPEQTQPVETVVEEPVVNKPVVNEPVVEEPVVEEPVIEEPVAEETVAEETVTEAKSETQPEAIAYEVEQIQVTQENFDQLFDAAKNNEALTAKVEAEIRDILIASNAYTGNDIEYYTQSAANIATQIPKFFPNGFSTETQDMQELVYKVFDKATDIVDIVGWETDQILIEAQKITDVIIRNYPPVSHERERLGQFADRYIANGRTTYSKNALYDFLKVFKVPENEIDAYVSNIGKAVAKPDDPEHLEGEFKEINHTFNHNPSYIYQKKTAAPGIARFDARRIFGKKSGEQTKQGRIEAREREIERLRSYDRAAMEKTEAIVEDKLEYLEDIEEENVLDEAAIETNENEIVAENSAEEETLRKAQEEEALRKAQKETLRKAQEEEALRKAQEEEALRKAEEEKVPRKVSEDPSTEEARKLNVQQSVAEAIAADNTPHVNLRMHKQCVDAVNSNELAQSVRQQLTNIKNDEELIKDVCRLPKEKILNIYRNAIDNNTNMCSRLAATEMVRELFIDIYRLTVKHDYTNMGMRVFMAQEMTDILMRNYSPVAFVPKVFDDAADYYIVGHKTILNGTMSKAHPNIYNHYSEKEKEQIVHYGRSSKGGTGQVEAYINRRDRYKTELSEYINQNKAMGANVLDADYIKEDVISAYRVQYLDACGATKAIKANVSDVTKILNKAGVNESDKNAQKFVDGIMFEMPSIYDNVSHFARLNGTFGDMMTYMSKEVFYRAYGNIQDYVGIHEVTRLALAQQLADVILKAYSPAKFNDACKPEYTNGFAISDATNIKVALEKNDIKLTDEQISQLKEDVAYANEHLGEALGEGKVDIIAEYKHIEERKRLDEEDRRKAEEEARRKAEEEEARRKAEEESKVEEPKAEPDASARYKRESKKIPLKLGKNIDVNSISDIYKEFLLSRSDDNLTASVKAQLAEILLKNGVERSKVGSMVKDGFPIIINGMDDLYKKHVAEAIYRDTPEVVTLYFFEWLAPSFYDRFASFESAEENVVLIQKIADVFFKNYSPVAFTDGILDKYADNYQINHPRELIEDFAVLHTKYGGEVTPELKAAIEEAKNKLNGIELANKDIKVEDFEKEIPIVKTVKAEKPKVEPKVEPKVAPKEEPKVEEKPKYERKAVEKYERKVERREIGSGKSTNLTNDDIRFLYNECEKSIKDPKLTEYVKSQIGEILFVSGVEESKIQTTVDKIANKCIGSLGMLSFYDDRFDRCVRNMTVESASDFIVNATARFLQSATNGAYSSHEEELVVNQKILDVLLKNYSHVAFLKNDLSAYADNYIVNNDIRVYTYCEKNIYSGDYDKKQAFLAGVKAARENIESKFKADASKVEAKNDKAPIREQIVIDMSAADAPKVNASLADEPKVTAPKVEVNEPTKERIVVNEVLENVGATQLSDKVKEPDAPVSSKSKE